MILLIKIKKKDRIKVLMTMNSMGKLAFSVPSQLEKGLLKRHWETLSSKRMGLKK